MATSINIIVNSTPESGSFINLKTNYPTSFGGLRIYFCKTPIDENHVLLDGSNVLNNIRSIFNFAFNSGKEFTITEVSKNNLQIVSSNDIFFINDVKNNTNGSIHLQIDQDINTGEGNTNNQYLDVFTNVVRKQFRELFTGKGPLDVKKHVLDVSDRDSLILKNLLLKNHEVYIEALEKKQLLKEYPNEGSLDGVVWQNLAFFTEELHQQVLLNNSIREQFPEPILNTLTPNTLTPNTTHTLTFEGEFWSQKIYDLQISNEVTVDINTINRLSSGVFTVDVTTSSNTGSCNVTLNGKEFLNVLSI